MKEKPTLIDIMNIMKIRVLNNTVIVFDWKHLDQHNDFAVFDKAFREQFHHQRLRQQSPERLANKYWVSLHFRWGDVKIKDLSKPDGRSGLSFINFCICIYKIIAINPDIEIF